MSGALPAGFRIGHWTDSARRTGCTAVLAGGVCAGAADVRGGAPGTRETQLFTPGNLVSRIDAVVLCGGSAFGLAAAGGVARYLKERRIGYPVSTAAGTGVVPIVSAVVLFDLSVGDPDAYPDDAAGYSAAAEASPELPAEGAVGAGTGATVGKLLGVARSSPGGIGYASIRIGGGEVAAIAAVNAFGDVVADDGTILAGARASSGAWAGSAESLLNGDLEGSPLAERTAGSNTTLVCVLTDIPFDSGALRRVAIEAHDGISRAVRPVHTLVDGDAVFAMAPEGNAPDLLTRLRAGVAAAEATERAIRRAVAPSREV
ncbi:MAG: P1 family peptidase [Thermoanaerobaculia bacterium]